MLPFIGMFVAPSDGNIGVISPRTVICVNEALWLKPRTALMLIPCCGLLQLHEIVQSCQEYKMEAQRLGLDEGQQVQQLFDELRAEVQHALDKIRRV